MGVGLQKLFPHLVASGLIITMEIDKKRWGLCN